MPLPPGRASAGSPSVLARWLASSIVKPCFCADETLPGRGAPTRPSPPLAAGVAGALRARGIDRLYAHQARAFEAALRGKHVVVVDADGQRQEPLLPPARPPGARARSRRARHLPLPDQGARPRPGGGPPRAHGRRAGSTAGAVVYDGDTPADARRAARERGAHHPDQPRHAAHGDPPAPRELGAHAAEPALRRRRRAPHVPRRLRLARRERARGASCASRASTGRDPRSSAPPPPSATRASTRRGSSASARTRSSSSTRAARPAGERRFFLFNPPVVNAELGIRASYVKQAVMLAADLVRGAGADASSSASRATRSR